MARMFLDRYVLRSWLLGVSLWWLTAWAQAAAPAVDSMPKRMQACTTCHGAGVTASVGRTANEAYFPRIAGKPAGYLYNQLLNFRDGRRHYGLMVGMVEHLSDAYLMEMAQYFAALDLPYAPPLPPRAGISPATLARGQALATQGDAARGLPACTACHGAGLMGVAPALQPGKGSRPSMPALLGLPRDYMAGQLGAWQTGQRRAHAPDCMGRIAKLLTAEDIDALTTWLASQNIVSGAKPATSLPATMPEACGGVQ
ncbi:MAG: c-type cytochrome [Burkholderiaceae bacterium]